MLPPAPPSTITVSARQRGRTSQRGFVPHPTVVALGGEHDISTVMALTDALDEAMERDGASLVIDLSDVQFVGAATVGVIVHARELLRSHGRSLVLRDPSACAMRVIKLCGLDDLIEDPTLGDWDPGHGGP